VQRILITGGTGFVGTHLIRFLKSTEARLFVVSHREADPTAAASREPGAEYCKADIRNEEEIRSLVCAVNPNQIYHLASISSVPESWRDPRNTFEVNVIGSYNLFQAAMRLDSPPRILNVSTSQVYAQSATALTENSPLHPDNPYAATKAMSELLQVQFYKLGIGGIVTARAFNHSGPGQLPAFVLSSFAKQLAEMERGLCPPVLKVGNIQVIRDFMDVRDVVKAYCGLLQKGVIGEIYNVCSGRGYVLADLVNELMKICAVPVKIEIDPSRFRPSELPTIVGDASRLRGATGWKPQIPMQDTLKDLLAYWRKSIDDSLAMGKPPLTERWL
jgi:GDP-4-dehydro-6-deoxy-D-mannose reductase